MAGQLVNIANVAGPQLFQVGFDKGVQWTADMGGVTAAINVTGWGYKDGGDILEVTHSGTAGFPAFLAGIQRVPCNIAGKLDAGYTLRSIGLRFGAKGILAFTEGTFGLSSPIVAYVHVIVEDVPYQSSVNGVVEFTATFRSDALMANGTLVNPQVIP
jgi:hypothetical protein